MKSSDDGAGFKYFGQLQRVDTNAWSRRVISDVITKDLKDLNIRKELGKSLPTNR